MAFGAWPVGHYQMTFTPAGESVPIDPGFIDGPRRLIMRSEGIPITTDEFGDTVVDGIYRGQTALIQSVFKERTPFLLNMMMPFSDRFGQLGEAGQLWQDHAGQIILTAKALSPVAQNPLASMRVISANKCVILEGDNREMLLGNQESPLPVVFRLMPYGTPLRLFDWV